MFPLPSFPNFFWVDIPRSVWRLLCNPVYMVLMIGGCCEICIVSGFCVFLPKYLETQFGISKSAANLLTGISSYIRVFLVWMHWIFNAKFKKSCNQFWTFYNTQLHFPISGGIAIPGAVFGIMIGGYLLKRCQLGAKGKISIYIYFASACWLDIS